MYMFFFFFKQKTAYEMRISGWSSDVCSSDLSRPVSEAASQQAMISRKASHGAQRRWPATKPPPRKGIRRSCFSDILHLAVGDLRLGPDQIGRASCRERVCQYV